MQYDFNEMNDILTGVVANILTLFLTILGGFTLYLAAGRRKLINFFGLGTEKTLRIFVGHVPADGIPQGLVGFQESSEARNIEGLFKSVVPGLSEQPGLLKFLQLADIEVIVKPARKDDPTVTLANSTISLGLPSTNHASSLIELELRCPIRFNLTTGAIEYEGRGFVLVPNGSTTKGVIVRICRNGMCYFYIAGMTEPATSGAARYLLKHWRSMRKKYEDGTGFYYLVESEGGSGQTVVSIADHELPLQPEAP